MERARPWPSFSVWLIFALEKFCGTLSKKKVLRSGGVKLTRSSPDITDTGEGESSPVYS